MVSRKRIATAVRLRDRPEKMKSEQNLSLTLFLYTINCMNIIALPIFRTINVDPRI